MGERTCVITGGGRGIGLGITRAFAAAGWRVLVGARTDPGLSAEFGDRVRFLRADVRSFEDQRALARAALGWSTRLDAWVNNAGFSQWRPLDQVDEEFLDAMLATNLKGLVFGCKAAAEALSQGGAIVNVSSLAGKRGSANNSVYCATKFAANGITQALAKELGPRGIRVNAVCPVYVHTDGVTEALRESWSPAGGGDVERYLSEYARANAALQRLPTADEVGALCLFLASEAASAIAGQCINIDCGVLPQ